MYHPINITDTLQLGWVFGKIYVTLTIVFVQEVSLELHDFLEYT